MKFSRTFALGLVVCMSGCTSVPVLEVPTSTSSSSSSSAVSSSLSMSSSSVREAEAYSSIAPFDGCKDIHAYVDQPWFRDLRLATGFQIWDGEVPEGCLSSQYFIFIRNIPGKWESMVYRYDVQKKEFEQSSPKGTYSGLLHVDRFGARNGKMIPLFSGTCKTDIYNVAENSFAATTDACRTSLAYCEGSRTQATGSEQFPILPEYQRLGFLGQIFTAAKCGPKRLQETFGGEKATYNLGSAIWLKPDAGPEVQDVLQSLGFACSADEGCKKWELKTSISIGELLKLQPYVWAFTADDCRMCG